MRTFLATHWKSIVALIILVLLAVFVVPTGTASPALAARLQARADAVVQHTAGTQGLDGAASYIAATLAGQGYRVHVQRDVRRGRVTRKIEAWRAAPGAGDQPQRSFILAARYGSPDTDQLAPTAALLEVARLLRSVQPAAGTEIRFVFFIGRAPADPPFNSFVAYAGPHASLGPVGTALAFFRNPPDGPAGALAAPAWVQGVTLGHLRGDTSAGGGAMLLADIGALHSPCVPTTSDSDAPDYKTIARMVRQLAQAIGALAGVTKS